MTKAALGLQFFQNCGIQQDYFYSVQWEQCPATTVEVQRPHLKV